MRRWHREPRPALGKLAERPLSAGQWIFALFILPTLAILVIGLVAWGLGALIGLAD
jgi:hypothetical protein